MIGHCLDVNPSWWQRLTPREPTLRDQTPPSGFIWPARCRGPLCISFHSSNPLQFLPPILHPYRKHERSNRRVHSVHGPEARNVRNCYPSITPPKLTAQRTALVCERKSWFFRSLTTANLSSLQFCFLSQKVLRTASWSLAVMDDTGIQRLCS